MGITIETTVSAPIENVWSAWTRPEHIVRWNFAAQDWQCPRAEVDLIPGGRFKYRMEAKDGSMGFDFEGKFTAIDPNRKIDFVLEDKREVSVGFIESEAGVRVIETFDTENEMTDEQQRQGWQSILDNFKQYVETGLAR